MAKVCSVVGCGKAVKARGWCNTHYDRWHRWGDPHALKRDPPVLEKPAVCSHDGCQRKVLAKGLCTTHYHQNHLANSAECAVKECKKPRKAKGYCQKHYERFLRHGDPEAHVPDTTPAGEQSRWIHEHSKWTSDDCLPWPYKRNEQGYGVTRWDGRKIGAHRAMCIVVNGSPPSEEHQTAHSCGNGHEGCVNPNHLRWATPKENAQDRILHGTNLPGEESPVAKLTEADVLAIRNSKKAHKSLSKKYNVSLTYIYMLKKGLAWKHLD